LTVYSYFFVLDEYIINTWLTCVYKCDACKGQWEEKISINLLFKLKIPLG